MNIGPVILEGSIVRLEPMTPDHLDVLWEAGSDESLWRLIPTNIASRDDMLKYIESALADCDRGVALPFVTIERSSGKVIGSTRLGNIDSANLRTEIGWTWVTPKFQRTPVNTEAKLFYNFLKIIYKFSNGFLLASQTHCFCCPIITTHKSMIFIRAI